MFKPKCKIIITNTDKSLVSTIKSNGINKVDLMLCVADILCKLIDEIGAEVPSLVEEFVNIYEKLLDKHVSECTNVGEVN